MMNEDHDMRQRGIAVLLREAADQVEPGMAPYQAVVRGGRRRKARRWAAGAVATLALTGVAATLGANVLMTGQAAPSVAAQTEPSPQERHVYTPWVTPLADLPGGKTGAGARMSVEVWGAPRTAGEIREQQARMIRQGVWQDRRTDPVRVGDVWFSVVTTGLKDGRRAIVIDGLEQAAGSGYVSYGLPKDLVSGRWIVGQVSPDVRRILYSQGARTAEAKLIQVAGLRDRWFVAANVNPGTDLNVIRTPDARNQPKTGPTG